VGAGVCSLTVPSAPPVSLAYPQISAAAERVAVEQGCHVKVIQITPEEVMPFLNIKPGDPSQMDPNARALDIKACLDVLFECGSGNDIENVLRQLEVKP